MAEVNETAAASAAQPPGEHAHLKRRGLIAGGAALVAAVLAKQAASPVSAWDSTHTFQSAVGSATSSSPDVAADAIQGYADGANNAGVFGRNNALNGVGVYGMPPSGIGVSGESTSGAGVSGFSTGSYGVVGGSTAVNFSGVVGISNTSGSHAVTGAAPLASSLAGNFAGPVLATTQQNIALQAISTVSHSLAATSYTAGFAGLLGQTVVTNGYGLLASAVAGGIAAAFTGPVYVNGNFIAYGGTKSAAVPHPDGSYRLLYCVESPESWFEDFGFGQLSGGKATVTLDADFATTVLTDAYFVFLTPEGDTNGLYVTSKTATGFTVQEQKGGTSGASFAYRIVAKRKDITGARLAKVPPPHVPAVVPTPEVPVMPGLPPPPTVPAIDPNASFAANASGAAPSSVRSPAPSTAKPSATTTPTATTPAATTTPTPSGAPAVVASPRATTNPTSVPPTAAGSVAPVPPKR